MAYRESTAGDGSPTITFLYKLVPGLTTRSFGVECARLARVPNGILEKAEEVSSKTRDQVDALVKRAQYVLILHWLRRVGNVALIFLTGPERPYSVCGIASKPTKTKLYKRDTSLN